MSKNSFDLRIGISANNAIEYYIAEYLRVSGSIKSKSMDALTAYYYSIALSKLGASKAEIELAAIDSISKLSSQISHICNYHRLNDGILVDDGRNKISSIAITPVKSATTAVTQDKDDAYDCEAFER